MANYCSSLPAYIYSDKRPEPPKQEDYTLVTEEDIEMLDKLDKIKELAKHLIR